MSCQKELSRQDDSLETTAKVQNPAFRAFVNRISEYQQALITFKTAQKKEAAINENETASL